MSNKKTESKKKNNSKAKLYTCLKVIGVLLLIGIGTTIGLLASVSRDLPAWDAQQLSGAKTTFIYDQNEQLISNLHAEENRTEVSLSEIPDDLINAFIATEDVDFYDHQGINVRGIMRAVVRNIQDGDLTGQGASTITQQLARNAFLTFDKEWERKLQEIILAFKLESEYSKDEILAMYLNKVYFGAGAYGVQAAADTYFAKDVSDLTLEESALIAGLVQSPSSYNPFQHYDRAKARQEIVLNNMANVGFIDQNTANEAKAIELEFKKKTSGDKEYGFFVDGVIDEANQILTDLGYEDPTNMIYRSGLRIYTTMDSSLQRHAEEIFSNPNNFPNQTVAGELIQTGMVLLDHSNGEIKAVMGGRSYDQQRGLNRAINAHRQPGSALKPLAAYAPALEMNHMPYNVMDDSPISIKVGNDIFSPENHDKQYRGLITLRTALQYSVNTVAVQIVDEIGIRNSFEFLSSLGFEGLLDTPGHNDLGLSPLGLGSLTKGATPLEMAAAYGTVANRGVYAEPHFITRIIDDNGVELYNHNPQYKQVMSEESAWLLRDMMRTVVTSGTGTNFIIPDVYTAGKTGTSDDTRDAWFCGVSSKYSGAVWMGYDREHTMNNVYGGSHPALLLKSLVEKGHSNDNPPPSSKPNSIVHVTVCSKSGNLPSESCPEDEVITDYSLRSVVPTEQCDLHEMTYVCPESGKLAGQYCPDPELQSVIKKDEEEIEYCDIHTEATLPGMFSRTVSVCRDPSHEGQLYRANTPNQVQQGGCPEEYIEEVIIQPGEKLPYCPHPEHEVERKQTREVIEDIINN
ncbi:Multimodular transpeptidase-transglycosylase [Candidatus Syntrophocurvum alkaliphilum]|uniref:Penicillin-binding protein 1A n=1 Tax=Candidatus Syntrophocurvum alkaliphilum TaxID=2293317 RepID=A0A6I6DA42_9FIRM|nr:PBP1A family penicillin-binding protein [Candidatus Syntrophocurvum alkaliphilum]QGT99708.1 Multimodular transpeptidase-transglycosylase [Candidatus Syntrophocurvum alkaliphilum]